MSGTLEVSSLSKTRYTASKRKERRKEGRKLKQETSQEIVLVKYKDKNF